MKIHWCPNSSGQPSSTLLLGSVGIIKVSQHTWPRLLLKTHAFSQENHIISDLFLSRCFLTLLPRDLQIHFWGMAFGRRSRWSDGHRSSRAICGDRVPIHGLCSDSFAVVGLVGQFWVTPCRWWAPRQIWHDGAADRMTVWHSIAISQWFFGFHHWTVKSQSGTGESPKKTGLGCGALRLGGWCLRKAP